MKYVDKKLEEIIKEIKKPNIKCPQCGGTLDILDIPFGNQWFICTSKHHKGSTIFSLKIDEKLVFDESKKVE